MMPDGRRITTRCGMEASWSGISGEEVEGRGGVGGRDETRQRQGRRKAMMRNKREREIQRDNTEEINEIRSPARSVG